MSTQNSCLLPVTLLIALAIAGIVPAHAQSAAPRGVVAVSDLKVGLRTIDVEIDGVPATVIIDTGAGITGIGPNLAEKIGCNPYGQLSGVRMTGEVLHAPWCGPAVIEAGGVEADDFLMYFDIASLLPRDWPRVDGIISLNAFASGPMTLDWPGNQIILESEASLVERTARSGQRAALHPAGRCRPLDERVPRGRGRPCPAAGPARCRQRRGRISSRRVPSPSLASRCRRLPRRAARGDIVAADLTVAGVPMTGVALQTQDIIYDGAFGADFLSHNVVTLDFASQRIWVAPR